MIVVTEPTVNGMLTAKRVQELSQELDICFGEVVVVANKVTTETRPILDDLAGQHGLKLIGYIPYDPQVARFDAMGKPIIELPEDSAASVAVAEICQKVVGSTTGEDATISLGKTG
jgi:CO dehydrogenase maturation factor